MTPFNLLSTYEISHFSFGDKRLNKRGQACLEKIFDRGSSLSFPNIFPEYKELKGFYRLMNHKKVSPIEIHKGANEGLSRYFLSENYENEDRLLFNYSDTTFGSYKNRQLDLGYIELPTDNGMVIHTGILTNNDYIPLGISHQEFIFRDRADYGKSKERQKRSFEEKESFKWTKAIDWSKDFTQKTGIPVVNVMDREADIAALFNYAYQHNQLMLIRSKSNRIVIEESELLWEYLKQEPIAFLTTRELIDQKGKKHKVTCQVKYTNLKVKEVQQSLSALHLKAINPPEHMEETEWTMLANTDWEVLPPLKLIDAYTKRWRSTEDFHKCLKTGCKMEERQFRNKESLTNTVALLSLVAIRLLRMRHMSEEAPDAPVSSLLEPEELQVANLLGSQYLQATDLKHCRKHTVLWWVLLLGRMGGHQGYKTKGLPGWQTLYKGWTFFQTICKGVNLSKNISNSS